MRHRVRAEQLRRAEARVWTGPAAHLIGGALDLLGAFLTWLRARRAVKSGAERK